MSLQIVNNMVTRDQPWGSDVETGGLFLSAVCCDVPDVQPETGPSGLSSCREQVACLRLR